MKKRSTNNEPFRQRSMFDAIAVAVILVCVVAIGALLSYALYESVMLAVSLWGGEK